MPASHDALEHAGLLLHALSGEPWAIEVWAKAESSHGQRPQLQAQRLRLPQAYVDHTAATAFALQAALAHAAAHLRYSPPPQPIRGMSALRVLVISAFEDARVERLMMQAWPGVRRWFHASLLTCWTPHDLSVPGLLSRLDLALFDPTHADGNHWVNQARDRFEHTQQHHGLEDHAAFWQAASVSAHELGQMRVRFDPQHGLGSSYRDDHSGLWLPDPAQASDTESCQITRTNTPRGKTKPNMSSHVAAAACEVFHYPEWNHHSGHYRQNWCTVLDSCVQMQAHRTASNARAHTVSLRLPPSKRLNARRHEQGDHLCLDALIAHQLAKRQGRPSEPRVFRRRTHKSMPLHVVLLLDLSKSSSQAHARSHQSLMSIYADAAEALAMAIQHQGDQIAIHGFASDSRHRVHYQRFLDAPKPFDAAIGDALRGAQLAYSTRLGAALRHAAHLLPQSQSQTRCVWVLTDGEPSDIDVFEPRYLQEDARAAANELRSQGVQTLALIANTQNTDTALRIFGRRSIRVLSHPNGLAASLLQLYASLRTSHR